MPENRAPKAVVAVDDREIESQLDTYVKLIGFDVVVINPADDVFERIIKEDPELIVLGFINLPQDSLKLLRKIRQLKDLLGTWIIVIVKEGDRDSRVSGYNSLADGVIESPLRYDELKAFIDVCVRFQFRLESLKRRIREELKRG